MTASRQRTMTERPEDSTPPSHTAKLRYGRSSRTNWLDRQVFRLVRRLREDARPHRPARRSESCGSRPASGVQVVRKRPRRRALCASSEAVLRRHHRRHMRAMWPALGVRLLRRTRRAAGSRGPAKRQVGPQGIASYGRGWASAGGSASGGLLAEKVGAQLVPGNSALRSPLDTEREFSGSSSNTACMPYGVLREASCPRQLRLRAEERGRSCDQSTGGFGADLGHNTHITRTWVADQPR